MSDDEEIISTEQVHIPEPIEEECWGYTTENGNFVIHHPDTPNNELYAGFGRPCPHCKKMWFMCSSDLSRHLTVCEGPNPQGWKQSKYHPETEQWCTIKDEHRQFCNMVKQHSGQIRIGYWTYTISENGLYLKRRKTS